MTILPYTFPNYFNSSSALQNFNLSSPSSLQQKQSFSCFKITPFSLVRNRVPVLCFSSLQDDMDPATGTSLYPSHRCKTIHLVRHAQGIHNVAGEKSHDAYMSYDYFDAYLTPLGWQQVITT
ncbi:hypothetical protein Pint_08546 [Pistacia integerrima]|uniref:Uncharacterized protein n=1 Tax=Pistacia integerrima TaxID=434235 RepID=A0ACC0XTX7_9ROSI|nr:hypothetical protein Pint_08546 [Pistacia integerrima]